jgi:hypothetical protein
MQAKADLHALVEQITTQIGQPTEEKAVQSCGYTSVVVGRGARFCDVDEYLLYKAQSKQESQSIAQIVSSLIKRTRILIYKSDFSYNEVGNGYTGLKYQSYHTSTGLDCDASYYDINNSFPYGTPLEGTDSSHSFLLHLNCSGGASSEYFPVQK